VHEAGRVHCTAALAIQLAFVEPVDVLQGHGAPAGTVFFSSSPLHAPLATNPLDVLHRHGVPVGTVLVLLARMEDDGGSKASRPNRMTLRLLLPLTISIFICYFPVAYYTYHILWC
jgi:hypothetical protein